MIAEVSLNQDELVITILETPESSDTTESVVPLYTDAHAFADPDFQAFLRQKFPEVTADYNRLTFPALSNNPEELESWEVEQIRKRKARKPQLESELRYLSRLLYEEFFSVDQNPDARSPILFQGVAGMTPGGLISHFYSSASINSASVESVVSVKPKGNTLSEAVAMINDFRQANQLIDVVVECTYPLRIGVSSVGRPPLGSIHRILSTGGKYRQEFDSVGFRLIRMLVETPEMMELIQDIELRKMVNPRYPDRPISRAIMIIRLWEHSQRLLTEYGTFADPKNPEVKKVLQDLLFARAHPELQIFFKYFSPSGYINQNSIK